MKKYEWLRTDTASVMFSAINGRNRSRLCRLSVVLKDEEVDPGRLEQAVKNIMPRFPGFSCRCRKGFFWVFFEKAEKLPRVLPERSFPAALRRLGKYARPELEVLYYKRRISLEGSHVLGDGFGYTEFAKALVAEYLILGGADRELFRGVMSAGDSPSAEEYEDSYARFYDASGKRDLPPRPNACSVKPDIIPGYTKLVAGLVPTEALRSKSRELGITITEYLAGVMIRAVIASAPAPIKKKIVISVPVNLRSAFPSRTLRNFLFETNVVFSPGGRSDISPEEIYSAVKGQIKASSEKDVLQAFINRMHGLTRKPHLKIFPYFIKKPVLNFSQKTAHMRKMTAVLSNVGNIEMPEALSGAIERIDAFGGTQAYTACRCFAPPPASTAL